MRLDPGEYMEYHYGVDDQPEDPTLCPNCWNNGQDCDVCGGDGHIL